MGPCRCAAQLGTGISNNSTAGFAAAIAAAQSADATVLVVGLDMSQEREGLDRTIVALPGAQAALIQQVRCRGSSRGTRYTAYTHPPPPRRCARLPRAPASL
jgi:hypothetical protein